MSYRIAESDTFHNEPASFTLADAAMVESYIRSLAANPRHAFLISRRREGIADVVILSDPERTISLHILPPAEIAIERARAQETAPPNAAPAPNVEPEDNDCPVCGPMCICCPPDATQLPDADLPALPNDLYQRMLETLMWAREEINTLPREQWPAGLSPEYTDDVLFYLDFGVRPRPADPAPLCPECRLMRVFCAHANHAE